VSDKISSQSSMDLVARYSANNYHPLPVVIAKGKGAWVYDLEGKRFMDMLSAYSSLNFGHCNDELIATAKEQLERVTLTSRAFHNDQWGPFCEGLAKLCRMECVLAMNTGAEAVETAIKTARRWGYLRKKIPENKAKIICCEGNFHGRTTTVISFSTDPKARAHFGPYTPGFSLVPYGDLAALEKAIDLETAAFLVEPIQGERGIVPPPPGYLQAALELCRKHNVLFIADEVQTGLGRTGTTFVCEYEGIQPDMYILGKALGGGIMPISAVVSSWDILGVFSPGDHGSTFGGNPFACAIACKVIEILNRQTFQKNAKEQGDYFIKKLQTQNLSTVKEVRGRGLLIGIEIHTHKGPARQYCESLFAQDLLCKDTQEQVIRLAPPLNITRQEIDWALERLIKVLQ